MNASHATGVKFETLEASTDAIRAREEELAVRNEAERLAEAAGEVKAERKSDD